MNRSLETVLIAGGTGFLGYHAALLMLARGVHVDAFALPSEIDLEGWYPPAIGIRFADLFAMSDEAIEATMRQGRYDGFVYALGPDDRVVPKAPALRFFEDRLVAQSVRIVAAAKRAGIPRVVVLGSYYARFDRACGGRLSRHHPYIAARTLQEQRLEALGDDAFRVCFLELPFIFGLMPRRKPLWKEFFLDHFAGFPMVFFPRGGSTACVDVAGVAQAVYAALLNGTQGARYGVVKENLPYREILAIMVDAAGIHKRVVAIPPWIAAIGGALIDARYRREGREGGLDHRRLMKEILSRDFSMPPEDLFRDLDYTALGFDGGPDVRASIRTTLSVFRPVPGKNGQPR